MSNKIYFTPGPAQLFYTLFLRYGLYFRNSISLYQFQWPEFLFFENFHFFIVFDMILDCELRRKSHQNHENQGKQAKLY